MRRGHPKFDIFLLRGAFRRVSFSQRLPRQQSFHRFEGFLCFLRVSVFEQMSFVRVDRVEDVRVRFHRFPQLLGKSTGELVEVEERFLVRRGAFERRCVRGATKHIPCVWYFLYPLLQLFVVEKRSKVFVRAFWFSAFGLFSGHTKEMYYWTLFFSAKRKKKGRPKARKKLLSRVVVTKIRIGRANSLDVNAHHHHARRSSRLRPRRVAFLAFRLARFSPVGGARSPKRRVTARGGFKVREICRRISTRRKEVGIRFLVGTIDQFEIVRAKRFVRKNASKRHFAFAVVASRIRIAPLRV